MTTETQPPTDAKLAVQQPAKVPAAPAKADVQHQEPQAGGSYTRNPETGALMKVEPAPAKTQQE